MCVPVSIGFGKTALVPARIEYSARQMCVHQRKHTATTCGISVAGTWFPSEESTTDPGPWMDHLARDCPLESDGSGENAVSRETVEALHTAGFLLGWNFFRTICPGCQRSTGHLQFLQDNFSWTINWNLKVRLIVVRKHSTLMAKSGNVLHRQFTVNTTNVMSRGFDHQLPLLLIWINFGPIVDK